jgi:hypothetical protein
MRRIDESIERRPRRDLVLTRLVEVLLIEALRAAPGEDSPPGLLRGLADARLAQAMRTFLGHASVESTRRYARLAENALVEVLREPPHREPERHASDKGARNKTKQEPELRRGPSRIRTWAPPVMSRVL